MVGIDMRDYGRLEAQVDQLIKDMDVLTANVQAMRDLMEQSKGGWRTLVWLGGIAGTIGGAVGWVVSHVKIS